MARLHNAAPGLQGRIAQLMGLWDENEQETGDAREQETGDWVYGPGRRWNILLSFIWCSFEMRTLYKNVRPNVNPGISSRCRGVLPAPLHGMVPRNRSSTHAPLVCFSNLRYFSRSCRRSCSDMMTSTMLPQCFAFVQSFEPEYDCKDSTAEDTVYSCGHQFFYSLVHCSQVKFRRCSGTCVMLFYFDNGRLAVLTSVAEVEQCAESPHVAGNP
eukprot:44526-Prorocentrum_minimum.AAC.3